LDVGSDADILELYAAPILEVIRLSECPCIYIVACQLKARTVRLPGNGYVNMFPQQPNHNRHKHNNTGIVGSSVICWVHPKVVSLDPIKRATSPQEQKLLNTETEKPLQGST
jgi:hypothetical protein